MEYGIWRKTWMVYVLDGVYKTSRKDINKQLSSLLDFVTIEDSDVMKNALQFYADTRIDFVDCILLSYFKTNNIQVAENVNIDVA